MISERPCYGRATPKDFKLVLKLGYHCFSCYTSVEENVNVLIFEGTIEAVQINRHLRYHRKRTGGIIILLVYINVCMTVR